LEGPRHLQKCENEKEGNHSPSVLGYWQWLLSIF
jgi:hypothetical protein